MSRGQNAKAPLRGQRSRRDSNPHMVAYKATAVPIEPQELGNRSPVKHGTIFPAFCAAKLLAIIDYPEFVSRIFAFLAGNISPNGYWGKCHCIYIVFFHIPPTGFEPVPSSCKDDMLTITLRGRILLIS